LRLHPKACGRLSDEPPHLAQRRASLSRSRNCCSRKGDAMKPKRE
jgi:hypothetical protein